MGTLNLADCGPLHAIQSAIQAALETAFPKNYFTHRVVPPRLNKEVWDRLTKKMPFVGLGWMDWKPLMGNGRNFQGDAQFVVFLVVEGTDTERALSGGRGPNLFGMTHLAVAALSGLKIGSGAETIGTLSVRSCMPTFDEGWSDSSRLMATVTVGLNTGLLIDDSQVEALDDLKGISADWGSWLPDLTDDMKLGGSA